MGSGESKSREEFEIEELGLKLKARKDPGSIGGERVWPAGRDLALAITDGRVEVKGTRVLEMGCGLALPSLAASRAGAHSVIATDRADLKDLVEYNAKVNSLNISFSEFDWAEPGNFKPPQVDLIIAADVLYFEEQDPFFNALCSCLEISRSAEVIIAYRERSDLDRKFLEDRILSRFQVVTKIPCDPGTEIYSLR